ncbi:hypothetical protein [Pseudoramibacter faecis]|uniref:hypothetical protein n=1 Tax=Pseudoramibacter faecis TaxID=3108534 RepID=UPI002E79B1EC|nr:hypothetical protein [Pseudoramibacter sp. HA2172]
MNPRKFHIRRKINSLTTALIGNIFNLLIILVLKGVLDIIQTASGDDRYPLGFGIAAFAIVVAYWVFFTYKAFANSTDDDDRNYGPYLLLCMLPMVLFTVIALLIMQFGGNASFAGVWNGLTFGIAPTLFLYFPYGVIYHVMGAKMPIIAFFLVVLVLMVALQSIGFMLGKKQREVTEAKERRRKALAEKLQAEQAEAEAQRAAAPASVSKVRWRAADHEHMGRPARKDPFSDVESPSIIETEAFSPVTDKMVEKVMREERRKERAAALQERRMRKPAKRQDGESSDWIDPKKIRKKNDQGDGQ